MKTEVCITIDTEFDIAGTFIDPERFSPVAESNVWCDQDSTSHGLGFLLSTFAEYGVSATFFVEALNSIYFGDDPMRSIVREIVEDGHDAQLHLHPVWTYFADADWRERLAHSRPNDSFVGRSRAEVESLIEQGRQAFGRWGVDQPVALRTGGLRVDTNVYHGMSAQGMRLASNVGVAIYQPEPEALQLYAGRHRVNGVVEVPVLTYRRRGLPKSLSEKSLTITGTSWGEMRRLLWGARRAGVGPVIILTHPHEFAKGDGRGGWRPDHINQRRLRKLCKFLAARTDEFEVVTFGQRVDRWSGSVSGRAPILSVPAVYGLGGIIENLYNDWMKMFGATILYKAGALADRFTGDGLPGA